MVPRRILIVYGTTKGQTEKVAERIAERLRAAGHAVTVIDADDLPTCVSARDFDAVLVGSSVTFGRHQRCVRHFLLAQRDALDGRPTALFSVSGSAAGRTEAQRTEARRYVDELLRETGWKPAHVATVAGAIAYTKYNPLLRWVMRRIAAQSGGPTDTRRDHEMTDWSQVDRFAAEFGSALVGAGSSEAAATFPPASAPAHEFA